MRSEPAGDRRLGSLAGSGWRHLNFGVMVGRRPAKELALALFLLVAAWIQPTHPANTEVRGVTLDSIYPEVGTAYSFTAVTLYGEGSVRNLPTLGCRFGEVVSTYQAHVPGESITCLTPASGPGFAIVGLAVRTGIAYAPVRDDISLENGANMFEFVQPWRITSVFPDETYTSGGQLLFIRGQDIRPELRCTFVDNSPTGATIHFVSSTLVVCEAEEFTSKSSGVLKLRHNSHVAAEGQQITVRHREVPKIDYFGFSSAAFGETITITASNLNAAAPVMLSWQARLGCQFGGVWVAASAQSAVNKIGCTVPASTVGDVQAVVSDLHSFIPLPLENDTSVALDVPPSGRFKLTLRESALVKAIVPAAGSPTLRSKTRSLDIYGRHLALEMTSIDNLCESLESTYEYDAHQGAVRLKCAALLFDGGKIESGHAHRIGFNSVIISSGPGDGPGGEIQYLLQNPPRMHGSTATSSYAGDVLVVTGENFVDVASPVWCFFGDTIQKALTVSSAVARCIVTVEDHMHASSLHRSASGLQVKLGLGFLEAAESTSNLISITSWLQPHEVASVLPDIGFSHGGTQVSFSAKGGVGAVRFHPLISCSFGSISPVSAFVASGDTMSCTSPALAPGSVLLGTHASRTAETAVVYRVIDADSMVITPQTTVASPSEGVVEFLASSSETLSQMETGCVLLSADESPAKALHQADTSGRFHCTLPTTDAGFSTWDFSVLKFAAANTKLASATTQGPYSNVPAPNLDHSATMPSKGASLLHKDVEINIMDPTPMVFVQRRAHLSEIYPGDVLFVVSRLGGMDEAVSCVISTGGSQSTATWNVQTIVPAIVVSSAVTRCEMPTLHNHGDNVVNGAALTLCSSGSCIENKLSVTQDSALLVLGEERVPSVVTPSEGSSYGGTVVNVSLSGSVLNPSQPAIGIRIGSIGPVASIILENGALQFISPEHTSGTVPVTLGMGTPLVGDEEFIYVHYNSTASTIKDNDASAVIPVSSAVTNSDICVDIPHGDVADLTPARGSSDGGTEVYLVIEGRASQPDDNCGTLRTSCRIGTIWPVLGQVTEHGISCITPAHAPSKVRVSAPKLVDGLGQQFNYFLLPPITAEDGVVEAVNDTNYHVTSSPKLSARGASIDVTATKSLMEPFACLFSSPVRALAPQIYASHAYAISSIMVRCEIPSSVTVSGVSFVEQANVERSASRVSFSAHRQAPECNIQMISPTTISTQGGVVSKLTIECLTSGSLTSIDARVGCRYGTVGPITATIGEGGIHNVECAAPAHAPGPVPLALTTNWRDIKFETSNSTGGQIVQLSYKQHKEESSAEDELQLLPMHRVDASVPMMSSVVPWLVWGGNLLHITGRGLPNVFNSVCLVGSVLVPAHSISSALVLCDPFPVSMQNRSSSGILAGGLQEMSLSVGTSDNGRLLARGDVTPLNLLVISEAPVVGVDVLNGWEQGGGHVNVELGGWAPSGLMDCHFGTVVVHGRGGGGAGWAGRAAMGRAGEWWSEATIATDVECVTPARQPGSVPVGVSLAHSTSPSYGSVEYKYL